MKRFVAGFFAVAFVLSVVSDAEAMRKTAICFIEYGNDGEVCHQDCSYMDESGRVTGRVIIDYNC